MAEPPEWATRPPLDTEQVFDKFVREIGGARITDIIEGTPAFDNADYLFEDPAVIVELKTLKTDFGRTKKFQEKQLELTRKYLDDGRTSFGALFRASERPREFVADFLRLFRPPLERILKKANSQIKETRGNLHRTEAVGMLILVNDDFYSLEPEFIMAVLGDKLVHSYSAIDAYVYVTLNHYVDIPGSDYAHLLWAPQYSGRVNDVLHPFINRLGGQWFEFLAREIGPFDVSRKTDDGSVLKGTRAIPPPMKKL